MEYTRTHPLLPSVCIHRTGNGIHENTSSTTFNVYTQNRKWNTREHILYYLQCVYTEQEMEYMRTHPLLPSVCTFPVPIRKAETEIGTLERRFWQKQSILCSYPVNSTHSTVRFDSNFYTYNLTTSHTEGW